MDIIESRKYRLSEAARILEVSYTTLKRFVDGYTYTYKGESTFKAPILATWFNPNTQRRYVQGKALRRFIEGKKAI